VVNITVFTGNVEVVCIALWELDGVDC